jgi:hypothetical protein
MADGATIQKANEVALANGMAGPSVCIGKSTSDQNACFSCFLSSNQAPRSHGKGRTRSGPQGSGRVDGILQPFRKCASYRLVRC